jgi:hypothetical protein
MLSLHLLNSSFSVYLDLGVRLVCAVESVTNFFRQPFDPYLSKFVRIHLFCFVHVLILVISQYLRS